MRRILLPLIGIIIGLGPTPFEQWHLSHLPSIAPIWVHRQGTPFSKPGAPTQPRHDPNTCAVCLMLHAPLAVSSAAFTAIGPHAPLGLIELPAIQQTQRCGIASIDCRGPPAA